MTLRGLTLASLTFFWRTHLAVLLGVAVAVGVLTGALLVGDSVRGSLRELFLGRLGNTDSVVVANTFFRSALATELDSSAVPIIAFDGALTDEATGRRRNGVRVYGVDERFWAFHDLDALALSDRRVAITARLANELSATVGDTLLLRVEQPSAVARSSLHGKKDDGGRTLRLTLGESDAPEFSLFPEQDAVEAIYISLERLQRELGQPDRANTILVGRLGDENDLATRVRGAARLEDMGVRVRVVEGGAVAVESDALMLSDPIVGATADAASELGVELRSVLTYLANTLRAGDREIPYSLVTALDETTYLEILGGEAPMAPSLVLNTWAASSLGASLGDALTMEYYVWRSDGRIESESADFVVDAIVPLTGWAADRDLAPDYPGISETEDLSDWDPPFPVDLRRVRDEDEEYWDLYRTTPKAFIRLARGQRLWPVQQGKLTSVRFPPELTPAQVGDALRARLDPLALGFTVLPVRAEGVTAASGATDFGEYFVYFSYFLVVAALLLTGLFFKLGVEQRIREVGLFRALGFPMKTVRRLFLAEGALLSVLGGIVGLLVALGYAWLVMYGLSHWWVDAVGTRLLSLHVGISSLVIGWGGGVLVSCLAVSWTLRHLEKLSPRAALTGDVRGAVPTRRAGRFAMRLAVGALALAVAFLALAAADVMSDVVAFMGAGNLMLVALLSYQWAALSSAGKQPLTGAGVFAVIRLGFRNASDRPGRSLVAVALIAFATFTIVAVEAFRKSDSGSELDRDSGTGGYALVGESLLPFHWDPNTTEGRDALNLPFETDPDAVSMNFETFRLRDGDDASCLNLYRPQNPRVVAADAEFLGQKRFRFSASMDGTPEENDNPWRLLERRFPDQAVPVIGDANSMAYVLHLGLGEDFLLPRVGQSPLRLRLVATLSDSVFQGELVMAESFFVHHFPEVDGFRMFLVETPEPVRLTQQLEERMKDYGVDVASTQERLARFHRVENTYLSTFQTLGGLGLVLGTLGLACVLWRNVLERRRELALLRAVGYARADFSWMILAENGLLLGLGLITGGAAAAVAIAPALLTRGGSLGQGSLVELLLAVVVSGVVSSLVAVVLLLRAPLISELRAD